MARTAKINRKTKETDITINLSLDGNCKILIDHPIGFMAHMLNTFAYHGLFGLEISASGDLEVDQHHLVEDTGILLGQCFSQDLGDKKGIRRNGSCLFPMDECLARAAVDISGRPFLYFDAQLSGVPLISEPEGGAAYQFNTDVIEDFWQGFINAAGFNLHLEIIRGRSDHHKIEALFKAAARSLRHACEIDNRMNNIIPSTKGKLDNLGVLA